MSNVMTNPLKETRFTLKRWLKQAKCVGRQDHYLGKRQSTRFQWQTYVQVEVQNPNGSVEYVYAKTKDISETGLGLVFRQPIERRSKIRVQLDDETQAGIVSGTVTHCTQIVGTYIVGIDCDHATAA